jgi:uncharacterized membrane protein (DUF4010 family)
MSTSLIFQQLGISLLLGLLVGLQRQHTEADVPGLRTFPMITVLGTVAALASNVIGGWLLTAGFLGVTIMLLFPNLIRLRGEHPDPGITTDIAALLMYMVGALLVLLPDQTSVAVAIGGGVAVLLQFKPELHGMAKRLGDNDLKAIMQFVLLSCVILPVLPNENYLLGVLNPREIWLMVVLIVGISLFGYIAYKYFGRDAGIILGGCLGGAISSTATTVSHARRTGVGECDARVASLVILIASTVVFVRILLLVAVVAPSLLVTLSPPVLATMLLMLLPAMILWLRMRGESNPMPEQKNPTQLKAALMFAALYAMVQLALALVRDHVGRQGLYGVAVLSGLTDMDAITLSTARMFQGETGNATWIVTEAWRLILCAALSNLCFKLIMIAVVGTRDLLRRVALLYALPFFGGLAILFFWP